MTRNRGLMGVHISSSGYSLITRKRITKIMITIIVVITFSQGIPSYSFLCFSLRESARYPLPVAVAPPPLLYESPTERRGFLPHPDILIRMVGWQPAFITEFSPAVLTGERERDLFSAVIAPCNGRGIMVLLPSIPVILRCFFPPF